jgi:hypothetical protein
MFLLDPHASEDSAQRIEQLNTQASQLTTEWAPRLDSAGAKIVALQQRINRLEAAEKNDVGKLLSEADALIVNAKSSLMDLPNKVQHATGSGTLTELPREFATVTSKISTTVNALETELGSAERKVQRLEKAAEQPKILRGSISPSSLSPIEVLGIHARNGEERRRYADQWAMMMR